MELADAWDGDVRGAAGGDRDAYARLINRTRTTVASIALAVVRDVSASEDVAQDVYLAAWQELPRLRNPASFLPWLRQLTRNRAHDAIRRGLRRPTRPTVEAPDAALAAIADPLPDAGAAMVAAEERAALQAALDELPDDAREVLTLFYREGRSVAQVAALLGLGEAAVKKRLQRARDTVRDATLARLEGALARTAPGAAFTAVVMGALAAGAPATATAAVLRLGALGGKSGAKLWLAKLAVVLGGATVGAASGLIGAVVGVRRILRQARDDQERAALRRMAWVNGTATVLCALALPASDRLLPGVGPALAFSSLVALIAFNHFVWLPRIVARREALERAEDPDAARRQRRHRLHGVLGLVFGVLAGGGSLAWALSPRPRRLTIDLALDAAARRRGRDVNAASDETVFAAAPAAVDRHVA